MVGECRALGVVVVVTVLAHLADSDPAAREAPISFSMGLTLSAYRDEDVQTMGGLCCLGARMKLKCKKNLTRNTWRLIKAGK
ncbi:hypothetical protein E2C01_086582 [Portunus trituberculatus]|uniref:Secreted protein n=1 Tax=Portunus trituberculatus TaxID=210409 RepID=A0A5B7JDV1_PORTR|nr:hypothetical protein [Portunus trituberculatus]